MFAAPRFRVRVAYLLLLVLAIFNEIAAKKVKSAKRAKRVRNHTRGIYFIAFIMLMCFVPTIIYFIYNLVMDPATPGLVKNATILVKTKTMGYLSRKEAEKKE